VLGRGALARIGIRLPGIEFLNQRVEAAYARNSCFGETISPSSIHLPLNELSCHSPELLPALPELL